MTTDRHILALDGWRGISILLVLACHLIPLGPKALRLNEVAGPMGMALFFTLSGFLITRFLLRDRGITDFLIRRLFRIVPLAWLAMFLALPMAKVPTSEWLPNLFFYANFPPTHLPAITSHFWSLCVEVQFYVGVALLVRLFGRKGLLLLPVICVVVTAHRVWVGAYVDITTWRRADEILAGALLALLLQEEIAPRIVAGLRRMNPYFLMAALALCSHPESYALNYARPYVAAALVGVTLLQPRSRLGHFLSLRWLGYVASISYALYIIHGILIDTWLGSGEGVDKYAKRPLLIGAAFALAHLSTFHFERHFMALGKRLSRGASASASQHIETKRIQG